MNFLQEIEINAALALLTAEISAPAAAQVPGFVAADIEKGAGEVWEQLVIEFAQEGQRAGMVRGERARITQERAVRAQVGPAGFGQFFQRRIFQPIPQMAEGILVRDEIYAEVAAVGVELQNFFPGKRPPIAPNRFVIAVGE